MTAVRTIAVGVDGSKDAASALRWACRLALQTGARLAAVHAVGLLERLTTPEEERELAEGVREVVAGEGLPADRLVWRCEEGDPVSTLARSAAAPLHADLVVVGMRGRSAHSGVLLGSTTLNLAEHCEVPVVVVPHHGA